LDDGLRAGLFTVADLADLPVVGDCFAEVARRYPQIDPGRAQCEALRRVFGRMVEDVMAESNRRLDRLSPKSPDDVRAAGLSVIAFSDPMMEDLRQIRAFLFARMYRHYRVKRMRLKADRVVRDLFQVFMSSPGVLPDEWREAALHARSDKLRARIVADYIAGMTDRFALDEHRKLTDPMARA
jgi:dGTPase